MLIILTGPSGSGKTTAERILERQYGFSRIISHTTRPPRPGEVNGADYYFVTEEEFLSLEMAEKTVYNGHRYGTTWQELLSKTRKPCVVVAEPKGARVLRNLVSPSIMIKLTAPAAVRLRRMLQAGRKDALERVKMDEEIFSIEAEYTIDTSSSSPEEVAWRIYKIFQERSREYAS